MKNQIIQMKLLIILNMNMKLQKDFNKIFIKNRKFQKQMNRSYINKY